MRLPPYRARPGNRARASFVLLVVSLLLGCASPEDAAADMFDHLPPHVGQYEMQYDVEHGAESAPWALDVADSMGRPRSSLTALTAFSDVSNHLQVFAIHVPGADTTDVRSAFLTELGLSADATEVIAGKEVLRVLGQGGLVAYVYSTNGVVALASSTDPSLLADFFRQLR